MQVVIAYFDPASRTALRDVHVVLSAVRASAEKLRCGLIDDGCSLGMSLVTVRTRPTQRRR